MEKNWEVGMRNRKEFGMPNAEFGIKEKDNHESTKEQNTKNKKKFFILIFVLIDEKRIALINTRIVFMVNDLQRITKIRRKLRC